RTTGSTPRACCRTGAAQGRCDCSALRPVRPCGEADNTRNTHTMRAWSAGVTPMAIKRTKKADPVHVIVKVDGRRWRRVLSLSGSRSDDRHYVLETRPNGSATVQFGDGAHGASASKALRVELTYRTGGGGNVRLCLRRTARSTRDLALWVAIRNRTHAISFGG